MKLWKKLSLFLLSPFPFLQTKPYNTTLTASHSDETQVTPFLPSTTLWKKKRIETDIFLFLLYAFTRYLRTEDLANLPLSLPGKNTEIRDNLYLRLGLKLFILSQYCHLVTSSLPSSSTASGSYPGSTTDCTWVVCSFPDTPIRVMVKTVLCPC